MEEELDRAYELRSVVVDSRDSSFEENVQLIVGKDLEVAIFKSKTTTL
jgi:hypothetical protein